jgi:hypothetical protein
MCSRTSGGTRTPGWIPLLYRTEVLLPCSRQPFTGPNPESDESNPHHHTNLSNSSKRYSPFYSYISQVALSFRFPDKNLMCIYHLFGFIILIVYGEEHTLQSFSWCNSLLFQRRCVPVAHSLCALDTVSKRKANKYTVTCCSHVELGGGGRELDPYLEACRLQ